MFIGDFHDEDGKIDLDVMRAFEGNMRDFSYAMLSVLGVPRKNISFESSFLQGIKWLSRKSTGKDLSYYDDQTKEKFIPYIIETSAGVDRTMLVCLVDGYYEDVVKGEERTGLRLDPKIAPIKAGVFPLVKRDNMPEVAKKIETLLRPHFKVFYDAGGAIGRRYRRQDEIGTPFGITVDSQTLEDETVTLRERDSMEQNRYKIDELVSILQKKIWE